MDITMEERVATTATTKRGMALRRKIKCIETGQEFDSITTAAKYFGAKACNISHVLNGRHKTCRGLTFTFIDEKPMYKARTVKQNPVKQTADDILKQIQKLQEQYAQKKAEETAKHDYYKQVAVVKGLRKELSKAEEVLAQAEAKWHSFTK